MEDNSKDNIFSQIILEQAHLQYINDQLDNIYDKIGEWTEAESFTIDMLYNEKQKTKEEIAKLKEEYARPVELRSTGQIVINYDGIDEDTKFDIYRWLNGLVSMHPEINYRTHHNETRYSKDFICDDTEAC